MRMDICFANIKNEHSNHDISLNSIYTSLESNSSLDILEGNELKLAQNNRSICFKDHNLTILQGTQTLTDLDPTIDMKPSTSCPNSITERQFATTFSCAFENPNSCSLSISLSSCGCANIYTDSWACRSGVISPNGLSTLSNSAGSDLQRVALMHARTKKDCHNRIERKRRDYINSQISDLGNLLPEELFRDNDYKWNKGNILKKSVEYISALKNTTEQLPDLRRETNLATNVIGQLIKHIQELERSVAADVEVKVPSSDYQMILQEWLNAHEGNQQQQRQILLSSPRSRQSLLSGEADESSPGISSLGTDDQCFLEPNTVSTMITDAAMCGSPIEPVVSSVGARSSRIRCTSLPIHEYSMCFSPFKKFEDPLNAYVGSTAQPLFPIKPNLPVGSLPTFSCLHQGAASDQRVLESSHSLQMNLSPDGAVIFAQSPVQHPSSTSTLTPAMRLPFTPQTHTHALKQKGSHCKPAISCARIRALNVISMKKDKIPFQMEMQHLYGQRSHASCSKISGLSMSLPGRTDLTGSVLQEIVNDYPYTYSSEDERFDDQKVESGQDISIPHPSSWHPRVGSAFMFSADPFANYHFPVAPATRAVWDHHQISTPLPHHASITDSPDYVQCDMPTPE